MYLANVFIPFFFRVWVVQGFLFFQEHLHHQVAIVFINVASLALLPFFFVSSNSCFHLTKIDIHLQVVLKDD